MRVGFCRIEVIRVESCKQIILVIKNERSVFSVQLNSTSQMIPVNTPDPALIHYGHYGQQPAGIGPDPVCWIWIGCFFSSTGSGLDPHYCICFCTSGPLAILMRYAGSVWPEQSQIWLASGETDRDHIRHFDSIPGGHRPIWFGSVFLHLARFRYWCLMPDQLGLNETRSDPPPAKWIETTAGISIPGRMVIGQSKSDPFFYIWPASDIDALCRIRLAWTKPDSTRLRQNGSGPHPAFLFRAGWSSADPNRIRFSTSDVDALSRICFAWTKPDYRDHIWHFYFGPTKRSTTCTDVCARRYSRENNRVMVFKLWSADNEFSSCGFS